ncbi:MAG TPA: GYD domain-containing protein [Chloroflexota bacterium]|nr:GYD domain-containing protein [Chloroflexota bacterium]
MVSLYYAFGDYDGVVIAEVPDDTAAAALAIGAVTPGHLKAIRTTKLITADEAMEAMRLAGEAGYHAPRSAG